MAVALDAYGAVLLASPDGEHFRTVDRLAMTAAEARKRYDRSTAPTLSGHDLMHLFGEQIAKLRLGRM